MSLSATAAVPLAPDPALPCRDVLLDDGEILQTLARLTGNGTPIADCVRVKAKYRIGASLRVLYRVRAADEERFLAARMFARGRAAEAASETLSRAVPSGPLQPVVHDEALETVFWAFPNDRKIRGLDTLADPAIGGGVPALRDWTRTRIVSYAPERAATGACLDADGSVVAYAKMYAGEEGAHSLKLHDALATEVPREAPLRLPRGIAYRSDRRVLWIEPMRGRPFDELPRETLVHAFERLGAALATFHALPLPGAAAPFERLRPTRVRRAAELIALARPDAAEESLRAAARLADAFPPAEGPFVPVHGDINFRNWLLSGDRMSLIDLDQVGAGDAAADLGGALAGLRYRTVIGLWPAAFERRLAAALLSGYAAHREPPAAPTLQWHAAAALLVERAARSITRIRRDGLARLTEQIEAVSALAEEPLP